MTTLGPVQVAASADDAYENDSGVTFSFTSGNLFFNANTSASGRWNSGFRFDNITIAGADTIDSVDFEIYAPYAGHDLHADVYGEDADDAVNFSDDQDVTTRKNGAISAGTATASWIHDNAVGAAFISSDTDGVDLSGVFQDIIDRGGWASGQAIVLLVAGKNEALQVFVGRAYDGGSSEAGRLTVTYTIGGGGPPTLAARRLLSGTGR